MAIVHPTSVIDDAVELAPDVRIGPHCTLTGRIRIAAGTSLLGHCYLQGPLEIGKGNRIYPFVCLGYPPQDYKWDPDRAGAGLIIGDLNVIREHVTIHRATSEDRPTIVGDRNMFMVGSHVAHDVIVGDGCVFANGTMLAGHCRVQDMVNVGGGGGVGQHTWVGRLAFLAGNEGTRAHLPPFMVCRRTGTVGGVNLIGLRRSGMSRDDIDRVKWAYRVMFHEKRSKPSMIGTIGQRAGDSAALREILEFLKACPGAICKPESAFLTSRGEE